ncbi:MAG: coproporphyrinogen-III oxidase family protein [Bacteroidetes bacterium]|nr:coproporphyrinogen-III oxidase family protein [Bacteroidota bacterium]
MAGIYIHIPFCKRKCHYCNFFSLASQKMKEPFLKALRIEMELTRDYLAGAEVNTVYFGGGTPSVFSPGEYLMTPPPGALPKKGGGETPPPNPLPKKGGGVVREVTLELNPEDVTESYVEELKDTWFNRFSLGVQSFADDDLTYLNRSHSAAQALRAVKLLQKTGYENISIDLIYGVPSSSGQLWKKNLEIAFSLDVPHISAYALTVEQRTPLAWMINKQRYAPVNDEDQISQFRQVMQMAKEHGFQQYEISNFSKPGRHSVHNTNYWNGIQYLGLGPSAHSYNGNSRRWNISNLTEYIASMEKGELKYEEEILSPAQKYNEYVMTSLRTMWGCSLEKIISHFGFRIADFFSQGASRFVKQGLLVELSGVYFLTDEGKLFADRIAGELFFLC